MDGQRRFDDLVRGLSAHFIVVAVQTVEHWPQMRGMQCILDAKAPFTKEQVAQAVWRVAIHLAGEGIHVAIGELKHVATGEIVFSMGMAFGTDQQAIEEFLSTPWYDPDGGEGAEENQNLN